MGETNRQEESDIMMLTSRAQSGDGLAAALMDEEEVGGDGEGGG